MWAFCWLCFCCRGFQHTGLLVTCTVLGFLRVQLPLWVLSPSWASAVLSLWLTGAELRLFQFSSVQFSHSVVSDSLRSHESQHARPPCPSPSPGVHSDSRPSSQWCHPAISSSVVPFSSCPQSLPASESLYLNKKIYLKQIWTDIEGDTDNPLNTVGTLMPHLH